MDESQLIKALDRDDSYRVIRTLAEGPSGRTELVRGPQAELLVRKRIPKELANDRAWRRLQKLNSPLLPQVKDLYWLPGEFVVLTTYIDGVTIRELVGAGPLVPKEAVAFLQDLCAAAALLHAHGIVHRDVSPGNVVINEGHARLIDLGNARAYVEGARHDTTRLGTWGFAAPEQFGFAQTDARSDVYALGSMLGYMLTGIEPGDQAFEQALTGGKTIPDDLQRIVLKARAFEPSTRYQTADELAAALRSWAQPAGTTSRVAVMPIELTWPLPDSSARERTGDTSRERTDGTPREKTEGTSRAGNRISWRDAGLLRQLAIIANWMFFLFWAACFLVVGLDPNAKEWEWTPLTYLFIGVVEAPICAMIGYEIHQALLHRGRYNIAKGRIFVLLKRMVLLLALAFAALFICYLVGYVLNFLGISNLPGRGV